VWASALAGGSNWADVDSEDDDDWSPEAEVAVVPMSELPTSKPFTAILSDLQGDAVPSMDAIEDLFYDSKVIARWASPVRAFAPAHTPDDRAVRSRSEVLRTEPLARSTIS
jgi:hypothetical protein